jgi:hypothetical protein
MGEVASPDYVEAFIEETRRYLVRIRRSERSAPTRPDEMSLWARANSDFTWG